MLLLMKKEERESTEDNVLQATGPIDRGGCEPYKLQVLRHSIEPSMRYPLLLGKVQREIPLLTFRLRTVEVHNASTGHLPLPQLRNCLRKLTNRIHLNDRLQ